MPHLRQSDIRQPAPSPVTPASQIASINFRRTSLASAASTASSHEVESPHAALVCAASSRSDSGTRPSLCVEDGAHAVVVPSHTDLVAVPYFRAACGPLPLVYVVFDIPWWQLSVIRLGYPSSPPPPTRKAVRPLVVIHPSAGVKEVDDIVASGLDLSPLVRLGSVEWTDTVSYLRSMHTVKGILHQSLLVDILTCGRRGRSLVTSNCGKHQFGSLDQQTNPPYSAVRELTVQRIQKILRGAQTRTIRRALQFDAVNTGVFDDSEPAVHSLPRSIPAAIKVLSISLFGEIFVDKDVQQTALAAKGNTVSWNERLYLFHLNWSSVLEIGIKEQFQPYAAAVARKVRKSDKAGKLHEVLTVLKFILTSFAPSGEALEAQLNEAASGTKVVDEIISTPLDPAIRDPVLSLRLLGVRSATEHIMRQYAFH
ncbi:hypothetical protein JB92DRAFT_3127942 [Gautieria morchelliformis]|nr:hypothetical protein JB92DRAFT_3127942 [Gautieria morchelliformis]